MWFITGAGSGVGAGPAKTPSQAGDRVEATGRNLAKVRDAYRDVFPSRENDALNGGLAGSRGAAEKNAHL